MSKKGIFVSLEGPDCSGKSTNLSFIRNEFETRGYRVMTLRDPGGTEVGEEIRVLLLSNRKDREPIHTKTELLLFVAARIQLLELEIKPFLEEENTVFISDRFIDSTYAYQGCGNGLVKEVRDLEALFFSTDRPDATIFFDVDFEESLIRLALREKEYNRLNARDLSFRQKVFKGYQQCLEAHTDRMLKVDANQSLERVQSDLVWVVEEIIRRQQRRTF